MIDWRMVEGKIVIQPTQTMSKINNDKHSHKVLKCRNNNCSMCCVQTQSTYSGSGSGDDCSSNFFLIVFLGWQLGFEPGRPVMKTQQKLKFKINRKRNKNTATLGTLVITQNCAQAMAKLVVPRIWEEASRQPIKCL